MDHHHHAQGLGQLGGTHPPRSIELDQVGRGFAGDELAEARGVPELDDAGAMVVVELLDVVEKGVLESRGTVGAAEVGEGDKVNHVAQDLADDWGVGEADHGENAGDAEELGDFAPDRGGPLAVDVGVKVNNRDWGLRQTGGFSAIIQPEAVGGDACPLRGLGLRGFECLSCHVCHVCPGLPC